jgi:dimethylamine monooxygenase subunit A
MHRDWNRIFPPGNHRWTMGLRPAEVGEYFAPTAERDSVLRERRGWLADDFSAYAAALPGAEQAIDETRDYLAELGLPIPAGPVADPASQLAALGSAVEQDLAWLQADTDGTHRLTGGVVCFPSSWALTEKLGLPIREVHAPVPKLDEQLGRQVDSFLAKLEPGAAWTRENWSLAGDAELNHHPARPRGEIRDDATADQVWIRLEHQLLLRLPRSRAVLFGIHVDPVPLATVIQDRATAGRLLRLLETMAADALAYKRLNNNARDGVLQIVRDAAGEGMLDS